MIVVFAKFTDGRKEVYDPTYSSPVTIEKEGISVYQLTSITKEQWEEIMTIEDSSKAVSLYFPNI